MTRIPALTPEEFTSFGELLKFLRRRAGLSQRELSIAVDYSVSQISRLEQNQRAPDPAAVAARFVSALDLEHERVWAARLLELAATAKGEAEAPPDAQTPRHNLPIQLTSFVGREHELAALQRLFRPQRASEAARLVTLTGPGGTGKTRLALRLGADLQDSFSDGAWFVQLAPLANPALVAQTVATTFGLREDPGRPLATTLCDHLRARHSLLILDNCEHLIQPSAELAEVLLTACPGLHVLATSREVLGIAGERVFSVPPLSTPDASAAPTVDQLRRYEAVRLFVERATTAVPTFALNGENAPAVAQVCQRLDGIPLALELAAARLRVLPVEQIASRLDDRFRLLTGGSRTALPRYQTLQASIDWSYDLLSPKEQLLLRRLSVFAGGWDLEAAEQVCSTQSTSEASSPLRSEDVLETLGQLVNKSLVWVEAQDRPARYHMLETIRQYALAKLEASGEVEAVRWRHATYYLALVESGRQAPLTLPPDWRLWQARLAVEHDNLRAALTWCQSASGGAEPGMRLAVGLYWLGYMQSAWSEEIIWLEGVLAHLESVAYPMLRADVLWRLGQHLALLGDYAAGQARLSESLHLFQQLGDRRGCALVLERLGWLAREHGDNTTARLRLEESITLFRELGNKHGLAQALNTLGEVGVMQEDSAWAAALLGEALAVAREVHDAQATGWALNHLAHVAQLRGEFARATQLHTESLPWFREINQYGIPNAHQGLGESALAQGQAELATEHFREALELFQNFGDRSGVAWCLAGLAGAAVLSEEPESAAWLWGASEALRQSIGARPAPASRATRERLMAKARAQLGEAAFEAAWAAGQATAPEQAVASGLGE